MSIGNKELWEAAYQNDQRAVQTIVRETLGRPIDFTELEDLTQDVYTKAFEVVDGYDPDKSQFLTWLCNIAKSVTVDYVKSAAAQKRPDLVYDSEVRGVDDEGLVVCYEDLCSDPCDDPSNQVEAEDYYHEALSRMPEQMRQCIELRQMGHSNLEIATELGIADKTVRNLISDGRCYFVED